MDNPVKQEDKESKMYAMMRYINLFEKFPMQTQTLIVNKFGTRIYFNKKYTAEQIHSICDILDKALFAEQERLHQVYKPIIEGEA